MRYKYTALNSAPRSSHTAPRSQFQGWSLAVNTVKTLILTCIYRCQVQKLWSTPILCQTLYAQVQNTVHACPQSRLHCFPLEHLGLELKKQQHWPWAERAETFAHHQWFVGQFWQLAICSAPLLTKPSRESLNRALGSVREIWLVKKKHTQTQWRKLLEHFW